MKLVSNIHDPKEAQLLKAFMNVIGRGLLSIKQYVFPFPMTYMSLLQINHNIQKVLTNTTSVACTCVQCKLYGKGHSNGTLEKEGPSRDPEDTACKTYQESLLQMFALAFFVCLFLFPPGRCFGSSTYRRAAEKALGEYFLCKYQNEKELLSRNPGWCQPKIFFSSD